MSAAPRGAGDQKFDQLCDQLGTALSAFLQIVLAVLFGSFAAGRERPGSDIDIAVAAHRTFTAAEKTTLVETLAVQTGRPIEMVDLRTAGEPLLGQILRHGGRLLGSDREYGRWISRHLFEQADFVPYRTRMLAQRRAAWIEKRSNRNSSRCAIACSAST